MWGKIGGKQIMQKQKSTDRIVKITIIGLITLLATIASFFIFSPKEYRIGSVLGYFFIILEEILFFGSLIVIEKIAENTEQLMMRAGAGVVWGIEKVVSITISALWMYLRFFSTKSFISIQIVLILIASLLSTLIYFSSVSVLKSNTQTIEAVNNIQNMKMELELVKKKYCQLHAPLEKYTAELQHLIEELEYSDTSVIVQEDAVLMKKISTLKIELETECVVEERMKELLAEIKISIETRKLQAKTQNMGRI